ASPVNCGACGVSCLNQPGVAAGTCEQGACIIDACLPGFGDCDGDASNGCEVALNQPSACGACGVSCGTGERCDEGICRCGMVSNAAGQACPSGDVCCNGACVAPGDAACSCNNCTAQELCCDGSCVIPD